MNARAWLVAMISAVQEVARDAFGFSRCEFETSDAYDPKRKWGSFIAMVGDESSLQIGIACSHEGCRTLAASLLGFEDDELEDFDDDEMIDGFCEVINMIGGLTKRKYDDQRSSFHLGLPTFVQGQIRKSESQEVAYADGKIGPVPVELIVFRQSNNGAATKSA